MSGISLGDELEHIAAALSGVLQLVEQQANGDAAARAPAGLLSIVIERVRLVRRVVKGDMPAEVLVAAHNHRSSVGPGEDGDVVLPLRAQGPAHAAGRRRTR